MKRIATCLSLCLAATSVQAAEVAVPFDDQSQTVAFQMPALMDACVAGLSLRGDPTACRSVSAGLSALASMVKTAQTKAAADKAAADRASADMAAAEKTAADAAKAKAEDKPADPPN